MKKTLTHYKHYLITTGWIALIIFIIFVHFVIISKYLNFEKTNRIESLPQNRNYALILTMITASKHISPNEQSLYKDFKRYDFRHLGSEMKFSVTANPAWPLHIATHTSNHQIVKAIRDMGQEVQLSYQLNPHLWLNYSETKIDNTFNVISLFFILEVILILMILGYVYSLQRLKMPLEKVMSSANRLGIDINMQPLTASGSELVQDCINTMNKMQERILDLINHRTRLLAAISHDLRTPITRLKLRCQYIEDEKLVDKINGDLDEMQAMISQTLQFAKHDMIQETKEHFNLSEFLDTLAIEYTEMNEPVTMQESQSDINFFGRPLALKRALVNIINNGLKYANNVRLSLLRKNHLIEICISDDGPGIPDDELNEVIKPFYRSRNTKSKKSTGVGLGLSIAFEIINDHNGTLILENHPQGGLLVKIIFKVFQ